MSDIVAAGNTVAPAVLALEALGFKVDVTQVAEIPMCRATRGAESYAAEDPVTVLGLVCLVEIRGWDWGAIDGEIDATFQRFPLL